MESRLYTEILLLDIEKEFVTEIATAVLNSKMHEKECNVIIEETLQRELPSLAEEVLIHSGAKHAFSQYKQIAQVINVTTTAL